MRGTDHTVLIACLAVGGAILAALIAAVSADIRQRRQLAHDRQLQDLAELRSAPEPGRSGYAAWFLDGSAPARDEPWLSRA
jgi:hypothetical protein